MIPVPVGDEAIYLFLDELAADGVITLNGAVRPYSRLMIRQKLEEAKAFSEGGTRATAPAAGEGTVSGAATGVATGAVSGVAGAFGAAGTAGEGTASGAAGAASGAFGVASAAGEGTASGVAAGAVSGAFGAASASASAAGDGSIAGTRVTLTARQQRELLFWLGIYAGGEPDARMKLLLSPAAAYYRDSLFSVTITPLFGLTAGLTHNREGDQSGGESGSSAVAMRSYPYRWNNGAAIYGNYRNWAFFAALRDNHQKPLAGRPEYLTRERGGHLKGSTDFSEMTGGISYMWKWGDIAFLKESPVWGSGYAGTNILSGRAPSFMHVQLHLKPVRWAEMTWIHGWLTSMVVDSTRSYWVTNAYGTEYREHYRPKYFAANIFSFTPVERLHISAGNSVVWSDPRITPYYLMPFFFYKSVDHGVNSGINNSNAQMFLDVSSNNIRHLHLYGTLFIDELSTKRFTTPDYNFFSWKGGARAGNFSFMPNLWLTAECTFTYPLTFQHNVPVTTYENQGFNLGHWLRDNSRSWYFAADWRPVRAARLRVWHEWSERGTDFQSVGGNRVGLPYLGNIEWRNVVTGAEAVTLITGGVEAKVSVAWRNVSGEEGWYPAYLYGSTVTLSGGVTWGF